MPITGVSRVRRQTTGLGTNQPGYLPDYQGDRYTNPQRITETQQLNSQFFQSIGGAPAPPPPTPAQGGGTYGSSVGYSQASPYGGQTAYGYGQGGQYGGTAGYGYSQGGAQYGPSTGYAQGQYGGSSGYGQQSYQQPQYQRGYQQQSLCGVC